ncbi:phage tail protein [uncultured Cedecea sp.]|uniref:phage tail fiber protein n=1 Tax=uncultured Cedecea sp. TaxID=988762 RepID=UPI002622A06A|nr:phage tail protein [uncultured Cedecea sp.]
MIYTTGTIAVSGNTLTGTGTNFTAAGSLIRVGCTVLTMTSPPQTFQITGITSGTAMTVSPAASPALAAGTKYSILLSDNLSVDGLAQDIAETFGMYQRNISGFADVMNGTGDVTITVGGQAVTVPGQKSLAKKGANSDITSLTGLKTALSIAQGGTGATTVEGIRQNAGLGTVATLDATTSSRDKTPGRVLQVGGFGLGGMSPPPLLDSELDSVEGYPTTFFTQGGGSANIKFGAYGAGINIPYGRINSATYFASFQLFCNGSGTLKAQWSRVNIATGVQEAAMQTIYTTANTTKAADGTLKVASPIVKIFHDGHYETNDESEGCVVTRLAVGQYLIKNCIGLNADAAWGGVNGGFDIPKDRNGQPLVWLDFEVNADGSVLVQTYHRTYPDAPVFAQNIIEGVSDGEAVDIPADQFVSVRVEMPIDSIWNQNQAAIQAESEALQSEHQEQ